MPVLSNVRHERFAQELAKGNSATDAYLRAGYKGTEKSSAEAASRLSKNVKVRSRVAELQAKAAEKATLDTAWVLEGLRENYERAMQHTEVLDREGNGTGEYRYEGSVANRSLELVGKHLGMFVDKAELTGKDGAALIPESSSDIAAALLSVIGKAKN